MLTNLSQRPDGLWRRWGQLLPSGLVTCTEAQKFSLVNFKSIWTTIKERSDNGKENENEWTVWICNLCLVPWSIFLSIKTKIHVPHSVPACEHPSLQRSPSPRDWDISVPFFDQSSITPEHNFFVCLFFNVLPSFPLHRKILGLLFSYAKWEQFFLN